jgi:hypothetical protein
MVRAYGAQIVLTSLQSSDCGDGRRVNRAQIVAMACGAQILAMGLRSSDCGNGLWSSDCGDGPTKLRLWQWPMELRLWRRAYGAQSAQIVARATELRSPDHGTFNHNTKPYPMGSLLIRRLQFTYRGSRSDMLLVLEFSELFQIKILQYKLPFSVPFLQICRVVDRHLWVFMLHVTSRSIFRNYDRNLHQCTAGLPP